LVAGVGGGMEMLSIVEFHGNAFHAYAGSRNFGAEPQGYALFWLDQYAHVVRGQPLHRCVAEKSEGGLLELDHHLATTRRKRLAGAQIERHPCPTPVIDHELEGEEGLGR